MKPSGVVGRRKATIEHQALLDQSLVGIVLFADGPVVYVNAAAAAMYGYSPEEMVGRLTPIALVHPEDRPLVERNIQARLTGEVDAIRSTFRGLRKDGTVVWCEAFGRRALHQGRPHILAAFVDITERRRAEQLLRESEERFRKIFEEGPLGMAIVGLNHRFVQVNSMLCRLLGYTKDELEGRTFVDITAPEDVDASVRVAQPLLAGEISSFAIEKRYVRKNGEILWGHLTASLVRDEAGRPQYSLAMIKNISERKRAEEALSRSQELYRTLAEAANDHIFVVTREGRIDYCNTFAASHFGVRPEQIIGRRLDEVFPPATAARQQALVGQVLASGERLYAEEIFEFPGGPCWLGTWLVPIKSRPSDVEAVLGVSRDITERKRVEAQLRQAQKMEAIGQLAGGIAHDFNNLLTAILGYSELVREKLGEDDPCRADLAEVEKAGQSAASLTRQLLAFSRRQILQPVVLNLNDVVANTDRMLRRVIGEDIQVVHRLEPRLGEVEADPGQIEQVLLNLAVNARDAMPGGGMLTFETRNIDLAQEATHPGFVMRPGAYVELAVTDTGSGMAPDVQAHIFEPFFTTKEKGKGTGLGLSTVYGIVKQSGGYVRVESEPGRGATFTITLPRIEADTRPTPHQPLDTEEATGTETILLVEDEESVRRLAALVLARHGYTVLSVDQPERAPVVAAEHRGPIHLLVSDVVMPGLTGPALAQRLVGLRPALRVLFISGYAMSVVTDQHLTRLGAAFLQKPFTAEELARKVRQVLDAPGVP